MSLCSVGEETVRTQRFINDTGHVTDVDYVPGILSDNLGCMGLVRIESANRCIKHTDV